MTSSVLGVGALAVSEADANPTASAQGFGFCLNTSTIREQKLSVDVEAEIAEPWIRELEAFEKAGGSLKDLGKKIADLGLKVESSIGFAPWIVDDEAARKRGLEQAKRDMEMVHLIGGKRMAAPPAGATDKENMNVLAIADRYRDLAEVGAKMGIIPEVEVWGFSKPLSRLGETVYVAMESAHPLACILPDIYHLYKGGSGFEGLKLIRGNAIGIFHMNDYPDPQKVSRDKIKDADRIYPGDGVAPLKQVIKTLRDIGYHGMLSLELFNPDYWKQDALLVAKTGLAKMRELVKSSL
jgi:sugar phosphate isomerase/epimerase